MDRAVSIWVLDESQRVPINTMFDLLRLDPSIDVRGRAPNGVQTDISIRGAGFGQTLVLLNGLRLSDALGVQARQILLRLPIFREHTEQADIDVTAVQQLSLAQDSFLDEA